MSIAIEFEGYVNGARQFDWGTVYDIAHTQWGKNDQDEWEQRGRDYFQVITPASTETLPEGTKVAVIGKMKTKRFDKKDGTKGIGLEVRAESITVTKAAEGHRDAPVDSWATTEPGAGDVPF